MKLPLKIAILGCGGMGSGHARAIGGMGGYAPEFLSYPVFYEDDIALTELSEKLVLAGVYDIDGERMRWAAGQGFHCYKSYDDILADPEVDIVLIALPNHLHKEAAIRAMRAGKHVLCEKPVMMSSRDLEDVIKVARETGRVFYPRQNRRWDHDYLMIKKVYEDGTLGNVFNLETRCIGSNGIPGDWRSKKEFGGGMMLDWGVHLLDRLLYMIPSKVKSVYCHMTHVTNTECDDGFKAILLFENGMTAHVEVGTCNFENLPMWYMAGDKGTAMVESYYNSEGRMTLMKSWEDKGLIPVLAGEGLTKTMAPRSSESIEVCSLPKVIVDRNGLYNNVVDTINGTAEQLVKPEEALRVLRLMEACVRSDELNQVIAFE